MESHFLVMFACIMLSVVVASHATIPENYWQRALPNTPMPKAIKDLLQPGLEGKKWGTKTDERDINSNGLGYTASGHTLTPQQLSADTYSLLFFIEKDLQPGTKKSLKFNTRTVTKTSFLPRQVAETIPFSSNKLADIFNHFSIKPQSAEAEGVKKVIKLCEAPAIEGEDKYCATSLESMIDFVTSKLGKEVMVKTTELQKEEMPKQLYNIAPGLQKVGGDGKPVACHAMNYMYPVYYCHAFAHTMTYMVPLVGADGNKAKAMTFCHKDTSTWSPTHYAFQTLNVKPGTSICHFLPVENIIWLAR